MKMAVLGGGAAGFFGAINAAMRDSNTVFLFEKNNQLLTKVKISGGGRCNVTHNCFDPKVLVSNYPRGGRELLGPFNRFGPKDTIEWFESKGVKLKAEKDGRIFPVTDSSQTIIDALLQEAKRLGIEIQLQARIEKIEKKGEMFLLTFKDASVLEVDSVLLATGSSKEGYQFAQAFGHTIVPPVPSLFAFNLKDSPFKEVSGSVVSDAIVSVENLSQRGPLLMTHFGVSGPSVLKLSAWGARLLHEKNYHTQLHINFIPNHTQDSLKKSSLTIWKDNPFHFSKNLWRHLLILCQVDPERVTGTFKDKELVSLFERLKHFPVELEGKTTHKEEFVTAGGIELKEINFKTMESKLVPGLYFAGEILDIDGVTGGFNFQNAWTTGFIAGNEI